MKKYLPIIALGLIISYSQINTVLADDDGEESRSIEHMYNSRSDDGMKERRDDMKERRDDMKERRDDMKERGREHKRNRRHHNSN